VIVVDDGSADRTGRIVRAVAATHPRVRLVTLPVNQGRGAARAAGVRAARGQCVAFVDADILLPTDWLARCLPFLREYDACGGTAVPDGDVAWIHRTFGLVPKVVPHTTTVTGSNGLFRRAVFEEIAFDPTKRHGEDVALAYRMAAQGMRVATVPGLVVRHRETKLFGQTLRWLFTSGRGASRQLFEHRDMRVPDMAFFGLCGLAVAGGVALAPAPDSWRITTVVLAGYLLASSLLHLRGKFALGRTPLAAVAALGANAVLLAAYYAGRLIGLATEWRPTRRSDGGSSRGASRPRRRAGAPAGPAHPPPARGPERRR
jgi:hypothetical protein